MIRKSDLPVKTCAACGRPMVWRRRWARVWDHLRYCSERCRAQRAAARGLAADLQPQPKGASSPLRVAARTDPH